MLWKQQPVDSPGLPRPGFVLPGPGISVQQPVDSPCALCISFASSAC